MKTTISIEIEFEPWFEQNDGPQTQEEWEEFFLQYLFQDSHVIGEDPHLVAINSISTT